VNLLRVLYEDTAGDPMREGGQWSNPTMKARGERLAEGGTPGSRPVGQALLRTPPFVSRTAQKAQALGQPPERNAPFEYRPQLKQPEGEAEKPLVRLAPTKKEQLGNFYRPGPLSTQEVGHPMEHTCPSAAEGGVIPQGVADLKRHLGDVPLGTSHDPSELAGDSLRRWWEREGHAA